MPKVKGNQVADSGTDKDCAIIERVLTPAASGSPRNIAKGIGG